MRLQVRSRRCALKRTDTKTHKQVIRQPLDGRRFVDRSRIVVAGGQGGSGLCVCVCVSVSLAYAIFAGLERMHSQTFCMYMWKV